MRKFILGLCLSLGIVAGAQAVETCSTILAGATPSNTPTCIAIDSAVNGSTYTSATIPTYSHRNLGVQAKCNSGPCQVIINVDCRSFTNMDWYACATITNPAVADANGDGGNYLSLPRAYQYRINVPALTFTSGTITVNFERYNN